MSHSPTTADGTEDAIRTIALHLGRNSDRRELVRLSSTLELPRQRPSWASRHLARLRMKIGHLSYERSLVAPMVALRAAVLGAAAPAPPRFLIRVDEFPHYLARDFPARFGLDFARRFHHTLAQSDPSYLLAVVPRPATLPLDPRGTVDTWIDDAELEFIEELRAQKVSFAMHGLTHRTRVTRPRGRSELDGLDEATLVALIERGKAELARLGLTARIFTAPFNRFEPSQYRVLATRFDVVCGGPESVTRMGFLPTPSWQGQAVYLPAYPPLYGTAREILPCARRLIDAQVGLWVPLVLHPGWEADDDFESLADLAKVIAPYSASWDTFLEAIALARGAPFSSGRT